MQNPTDTTNIFSNASTEDFGALADTFSGMKPAHLRLARLGDAEHAASKQNKKKVGASTHEALYTLHKYRAEKAAKAGKPHLADYNEHMSMAHAHAIKSPTGHGYQTHRKMALRCLKAHKNGEIVFKHAEPFNNNFSADTEGDFSHSKILTSQARDSMPLRERHVYALKHLSKGFAMAAREHSASSKTPSHESHTMHSAASQHFANAAHALHGQTAPRAVAIRKMADEHADHHYKMSQSYL